MILTNNDMIMKRPKVLKRKLERELKIIRVAYSKALRADNPSSTGEWLCDNYYILEREGRSLIKGLKSAHKLPCGRESGLPHVYDVCVDLYEKCGHLSQDELREYLLNLNESESLHCRELELLPLMLRAALLYYASKGCEAEDGAKGTLILSSAIKSMRNIEDIDFDIVIENVSKIEKIFDKDPAGIYPKMDEETRGKYRRLVSEDAIKRGISEEQAANDIVGKAESGKTERERHVGSYMLLQEEKYKKRGWAFFAAEIILSAAVSLAVGFLIGQPWTAFLIFLPIWGILHAPIETISLFNVPISTLPRIELDGIVPDEAQTLVTVSAMLPPAVRADEIGKKLEKLYRTNGHGAVMFCMLMDLKGAKTPTVPEDNTDIAAAQRVVRNLNRKYGEKFFLAVRPRKYSQTQKCYFGWERKRGAVSQLIGVICGEKVSFLALEGNLSVLRRTKYIIALDSDTDLPMDTVSQFVSAAIHPLNKPVTDEEKGIVTKGYGIIAPRVEVDLRSALATGFSRVMAGNGGLTAYDNAASDRYQDLFGEGIFAGKGLIDVHTFYKVLNNVLPEERILSHDILESGYLRTAFMSDVQVTDGFPKREGAYLDRLHRWIRGDWQNIGWLCGRAPGKSGRIKNPLNAVSKYKLFDNLRRSLTPVMAVISILMAPLLPKNAAIAVILAGILSASGGNLFSCVRALILGGPSMFSRRYYSKAMPSALEAFLRTCMNIIMLAQTGFVSADAIVRSLWRQAVSHRNMLQWVTAADSDKKQNIGALLLRYLPSIFIGTALCVWGGNLGRLCGIIFILNFPIAVLTGRLSKKSNVKISFTEKDKMVSYAAAIWRYYEEFCGAADNYLPPDNIQETPVHRVAHRTSPTNIGLMLLCILSARDFGFIDSAMLASRLERSIDSIEKLEKWKGNLLNWYDTKTLNSLQPKYVSTVDSGNFLCCLTALRQGIIEYANEDSRLHDLADRIGTLIDDAELSHLYNKRRKLFHIGYDLSKDEPSNSYYDLLMSEARMTSYYAVASRSVPKKHWGALGRTLAREGGYTGPVSWTGTMFEYFMPHLLLPIYEGSLGSEALEFAYFCQRRRVRGKNIPWGISESGFYAFDPQLNYQYKAHGVQKLGLKRGLNSDLVLSPYSAFLVLPFKTHAALKNLKRFENLEMTGRCGFYEAVDFTRERTESQQFAVIRSYMAHHVGMSMLSICNAVKDNVMQKRFMSDRKMAAAEGLLQEKIPSGAVVFRDIQLREVPQRAQRVVPQIREFTNINPTEPNVTILTNNEWTSVLTDCGASVAVYRGADITRRSSDLLRKPMGVFAVVRSGTVTLPLTHAPDYGFKAVYKTEFSRNSVVYHARKGLVEAVMTVLVHPMLPCEQRHITVKNHSKAHSETEILIYFEPCLNLTNDDLGHPAFSKLFIESCYDSENKLLVFTRKGRNGEPPLCLAVGFSDDIDFEFETSREKVLDRPDGIFSLPSALNKEFSGGGGVPDTCAALRVKFVIPPKMQESVTLLSCAASTQSEAIARVIRAREEGEIHPSKGAPCPFSESGLDGILAASALPRILYQMRDSHESIDAARKNNEGLHALWKLGISGDYPILYIEIHNSADIGRAIPYIRLNRKLRLSSINCDIAIVYHEGGDYDMPILDEIKKALEREKCGQSFGVKGGVYAIDAALHGESSILALKAAACFIAPPTVERIKPPPNIYKPMKINPVKPAQSSIKNGLEVVGGIFLKDSFTVTETPKNPWCMVYSNPTFGTLVGDMAAGYTWAVNSRENKLTPWFNDTRTDNRGEMLLARTGGQVYDLLLGARASFYRNRAKWEAEFGNIESTVTISVPERGMLKYCDIELTNNGEEELPLESIYYTEPVLGVDRSTSRHIKAKWEDGELLLTTPWNTAVPGTMVLTALGGADFYCCDRASFLGGKWDEKELPPFPNSCAAVGIRLILPPKRSKKIRFILGWAKNEEAAVKISELRESRGGKKNYLKISTPDEKINQMVNTWLPSQIWDSRIMGRTGFYQCGGAWGYRDQIQDVCSIVMLSPQLAKQHITRCAAKQFKEGDVLHWWHFLPQKGGGLRGVRTRYSDDLLWLPYAVSEYIKVTEDYSILEIQTPFLEGDELAADEKERYFEPRQSIEKASIYEHCLRAVRHTLRYGSHGLPLIGGGDWNDGFNNVGIKGNGESVWLAQFLCIILEKMSPICRKMNDDETADGFEKEAEKIKKNIDDSAWDGEWYLRAFFDDGSPMGSRNSGECRIDSLSQSFSVLSNMPDPERRKTALDSAVRELVNEDNKVIKLFTPAFEGKGGNNPGYVSAYPAGIRENGGQYTHAAVWLCIALLREGRTDESYRLLTYLNPIEHCTEERSAEKYRTEPYALAGDVSMNQNCEGRGGWSLYTGAAGWYYRAVTQELLGISKRGEKLFLEPNMPSGWDGFTAKLNLDGANIEMKVKIGGEKEMTVDGEKAEFIPLDGNNHKVVKTVLPL